MNNYEELHEAVSKILSDYRKLKFDMQDEMIRADYIETLGALYNIEFHLRLRAFENTPSCKGDEPLKKIASTISLRAIRATESGQLNKRNDTD